MLNTFASSVFRITRTCSFLRFLSSSPRVCSSSRKMSSTASSIHYLDATTNTVFTTSSPSSTEAKTDDKTLPTSPMSIPASTLLPVGSAFRFLSSDYPVKFPLWTEKNKPSFYDINTWPNDPMNIFAQWYQEAEAAYNIISPTHMISTVHWPNTMQIATIDSENEISVRTVLLKGFDERGLIFFTNYQGNKGKDLLATSKASVNMYWKTLEKQVRFEVSVEKLPEDESDKYFHSRPIQSQISGTISPQSQPIPSRVWLESNYIRVVQEVSRHILTAAETQEQEKVDKEDVEKKVASALQSLRQSEEKIAQAEHDHVDPAVAHELHQKCLGILQRFEKDPVLRPLLHSSVRRPSNWGGFLLRPWKAEFWADGQFRLHSRIIYQTDKQQAKQAKTTQELKWSTQFLAP